MAVGALVQWLFNWVLSYTFTRARLATGGYGIFFIFAGIMIIAVLFAIFCLPETQGYTLETMGYLFEGSARTVVRRSVADLSFRKRAILRAEVMARVGGTADVDLKAIDSFEEADVERALQIRNEQQQQKDVALPHEDAAGGRGSPRDEKDGTSEEGEVRYRIEDR